MAKAAPTARRLSSGEVELWVPPEPISAWLALRTLLGGTARASGHRKLAVPAERVPAAIAVLEWYFGQVEVLEPEAFVAEPVVVQQVGSGPLAGLPPELREKAFKVLARVLHPDVGGTNEAFAKLQAWREGG